MIATSRLFLVTLLLLVAGCSSGGSGSDTPPERYSISGQVSGDILQGVSITLNGAAVTTTDAGGAYVIPDLANGTYTIAASISGYTLTPAAHSVTISDASVNGVDFIATLTTYGISGSITVSEGGSALQGVEVFLRGDREAAALSDNLGDFLFNDLPPGDYTLTPSLPGYTFSPSMIAVSIDGSGSSSNDFSATAMHWTLRASGSTLRGVANSPARMVAVGDRGRVATSTDGVDWTLGSVDDVGGFSGITWDGSRFVAVHENSVATSTDGQTWTSQSTGATAFLHAVAWSGSEYVAVGASSVVVAGMILRSEDGISWTSQSWNQPLYAIAWSGSQFLAVGATGTILTSPDGLGWSSRVSGTTNTLVSIAWSGNQFVVGGHNGSSIDPRGYALTSPDGVTWTPRDPGTTAQLAGLAWSGSQFVAVGANPYADSGDSVLTSPDGITWTAQLDATVARLNAVVWTGSQWVAVGQEGRILTSGDGLNWAMRLAGQDTGIEACVWTGSGYLAVGDFGSTSTILTSPDATTWAPQAVDLPLYDVVWSGTQFVAVGGQPGIVGSILTSPDGVAWTSRVSGTTNRLDGITWSGSQFVAVGGFQDATGTILTSAEGVVWTSRDAGTTNFLNDVAWSGTRYVAVGNRGTLLTSADGISWTAQASPVVEDLRSLVWSGTQFLAVGEAGSLAGASAVIRSPDGITWSKDSIGLPPLISLTGVSWSGSQFLAVGSRTFSSPDGIVWTEQQPVSNLGLSDVVWDGSRFVVVGAEGTVETTP